MSHLRLIKPDKTAEICGIIEAFEALLDDGYESDRTKYRDCLAWLFTSPEDGRQLRIVFDQYNEHLGAMGKHTIIEDEYELGDAVEDCDRDGFETLFIHLNFNKPVSKSAKQTR